MGATDGDIEVRQKLVIMKADPNHGPCPESRVP